MKLLSHNYYYVLNHMATPHGLGQCAQKRNICQNIGWSNINNGAWDLSSSQVIWGGGGARARATG